jgi:hypothetical protein
MMGDSDGEKITVPGLYLLAAYDIFTANEKVKRLGH